MDLDDLENIFSFENVDNLHDMHGDENDEDNNNLRGLRVPRLIRDLQNPFEKYRENEFIDRFRFSKSVVMHYILPLIRHALDHDSNRGLPVPPEIQLTVGLSYYASNDFQRVDGDLFGLSQRTVSICIKRVSFALADLMNQFVQLPLAAEEQATNAQLFHLVAGMRSIWALIDGCLVKISCPGVAIGEIFRCRKGYYAINVMAAVDARGRFVCMDVRHPGSVHDQTCFDRSALKMILERRNIVKGILLGDPGYACERYLFTPIPTPSNQAHEAFNESLITTRSFIERVFG
ncbi:hypothetical protein QAD02_003475 [Eretmocerus hayati]|uniref:Uncharacterized protein n=1 Tax=Eretmocerus hayati TaxID=131215 RepID=A0ACC2NM67_9HYME|nr:hypothetical protein QAD02_003475 [Eretmocerus hayati]